MVSSHTYLPDCEYLIKPDANKGTYIPDATPSLAILPSNDFSRWLLVILDLELFMRSDIDDSLDYIPFGRCPFVGTMLIIDENGDIISSSDGIVHTAC